MMKAYFNILLNLFVTIALSASILASALFVTPVYAANLIVNTAADEVTGGNGCSLREAIINANNDLQSFPDCPSGNGADIITFDDSLGTATIVLGSELPTISDADGLTIDGGGDITVSGDNL
jgi:CSLREA domain-containing protein